VPSYCKYSLHSALISLGLSPVPDYSSNRPHSHGDYYETTPGAPPIMPHVWYNSSSSSNSSSSKRKRRGGEGEVRGGKAAIPCRNSGWVVMKLVMAVTAKVVMVEMVVLLLLVMLISFPYFFFSSVTSFSSHRPLAPRPSSPPV